LKDNVQNSDHVRKRKQNISGDANLNPVFHLKV